MSRAEFIYLLPYLGSLALSLGVAAYAWQRRSAKSATAYFWYVAGQTFWVSGFILELLSNDITGKIFWDGTQWIASLVVVIISPIFAAQYTEYKIDRPYRSAWGKEKVIQYLVDESGKHFDPRVVNSFLGMVEKGEI